MNYKYLKAIFISLLMVWMVFSFLKPVVAQNNAVIMDGSGDYLSIPDNSLLQFGSEDFTIGFWITFSDLNHKWDGLIARNDFQWIALAYNWNGNNRLTLWADSNGSSGWEENGLQSPKNDWLANTWYHIAVQRSGNNLRIFINGDLSVSKSYTKTIYNPAGIPLYIGRTQLPQYSHKGMIDDIRIWNYALSPIELKSCISQEFTGREPGLIAYYSFNETAGSVVKDKASNLGDGTMEGDATLAASSSPVVKDDYSNAAFAPVKPTGLPYNIVVNSVLIDGKPLSVGSQVAVFDGDLCVGASVYRESGNLQIITWQEDPALNLEGFEEGKPLSFKVRTEWLSEEHVFEATADFTTGNGLFGNGAFSAASLSVTSELYSTISISESLLNFNTADVNTFSILPVTIQNNGNSPLKVFEISSGLSVFSPSKASLLIPPGNSETIDVKFTPDQVLDYITNLTIISDAVGSETKTVLLHGTGLPQPTPSFQLSTESINFGGASVGSGAIQTVTVLNSGNGNLNISGISSSNAAFIIENPEAFVLGQNQNKDIRIRFQPDSPDIFNGILTIQTNAGNKNVALNGIGSQTFFTPVVSTGLPYNIIVQNCAINNQPLQNGDEIAVFDNSLCVGSTVVYRGGKGMDLDGSSSYMSVPQDIWFSGDFTFETWVFVRSYNSYSRFIDFGNGQKSNNVLASFYENTGLVHFETYINANSGGFVRSPSAVPLNQWTHIACVLRENTGTIYINGNPVASGKMTAPLNVTRSKNYFGKSNWGDPYLNSTMDEIRIWNYARSSADILANYNKSISGLEYGLSGYWNFETGTPKDLSLSAKNGTLINNAACIEGGAVPGPTLITAWQKDPNLNLDGFKSGNPISFKIRSGIVEDNAVRDAAPTYLSGNGTFGYLPFTLVDLSASIDQTPKIELSDTSIYIGQIQSNSSTKDTFYIRNKGDAKLSVSLTKQSAVYSINVTEGIINPGDSLMILVTFSPVTTGSFFMEAEINSNDPITPKLKIRVEGFSLPIGIPDIATSIELLNFSGVRLSSAKEMTFNVINNGTTTLNVNNITSSVGQFTITPTSFSLPNTNDAQEVKVIFQPTSNGLLPGILSISSNANLKQLQLSGIGLDGHFTSVEPSGLPYNIVIVGSNLSDYLKIGDEIAVYDDDICVGSSAIEQNSGNLPVVAWKADPALGKSGFSEGNQMTFKVWTTVHGIRSEYLANATFEIGDGTFGFGQFSVVRLDFKVPELFVAESEVFAAVSIPNTVTKKINTSNIGTATLYYNISELPSASWLLHDVSADTLLRGNNSEINLEFQSVGLLEGKYETVLMITSNTPNKPAMEIPVVLNITGQQFIESFPGNGDFKDTQVGESDTITFTIRNSGTAPLIIDSTNFSPDNSGFSVLTAITYPLIIQPMESSLLKIVFSPVSSGISKDSLSIFSNAPNANPLNIRLTAKGITPNRLNLSRSSISLNLESDIQVRDSFFIKNSGQGQLNFSLSKNVSWVLVQPTTGVLNASDSIKVELDISTKGLGTGTYVSTITIESNDKDNPIKSFPLTINVDGYGNIETLESIDFGDVPVGSIQGKWHKIKNTGTDTLIINSLNTNESGFYSNSDTPIKISPNKTDSIEIIFYPFSKSSFSDYLEISSNAGNHPVFKVSLQGRGTFPPKIEISEESLQITMNNESERQVDLIITNDGSELLTYSVELENPSGECLNLNGNGDYVNILNSASLNPQKQLTLQAWVYPEELSNEFIMGKELNSGGDFSLSIINNGKLHFAINENYSISSATSIIIGEWTHVAGVFKDNKLQVYINGKKDKEINIAAQILQESMGNLRIGRSASNQFFKGKLDEIAIWTVARNESEIGASFFQSLLGNEPGLALYYDFNSNQGNIINDITSNNNFGTLYGNAELSKSNLKLNDFISLSKVSGTLSERQNASVSIEINSGKHFSREYSTLLKVSSNDFDNPVLNIPLSITIAGDGEMVSLPDPLEFSSTFAGYSDTLSVRIINKGGLALQIPDKPENQSHFSILDTVSYISPYSEKEARVVFHPQASGVINGSLSFSYYSSGINKSYQMLCRGVSLDPPIFTPSLSEVSFGDVTIGQTFDKTLRITNDGDSPLEVTSVEFPVANDLSINDNSTFTLNQGEYHDIIITFSPKTYLSYQSEIVFQTNVGAVKVPVSGKGINAAYDMSLSRILSVESGCILSNNETVTVMLRNYGLFPASGFDVVFEVDQNQSVIENIGSLTINPNDSIEYTFTAKADLSLMGIHEVKCYVSMPGDLYADNDLKTIVINNYSTLVISVSTPASICEGEEIEVWASGAQTYSWNNGATTPKIKVKPSVTSTYKVFATDKSGCTANDSVKITVLANPPVPIIIPDVEGNICDGDSRVLRSDILLSETELPNKATIFNGLIKQWFINDIFIPGATDSIYTAEIEGKYKLRISNINGCSSYSAKYHLEVTGKAQITSPLIYNVCNNVRTSEIKLKANLPQTEFLWTSSSRPTVSGYTLSGTDVIPEENYLLSSEVADTVIYSVSTTSKGCEGNTADLKVIVNPIIQPGTIIDMVPENAENISFPIYLSWMPSEGALLYDLYIWPEGEVKPSTPFATGINGINYSISKASGNLQYGNSYNWAITARDHCSSRESLVKKFKIRYLPDLTAIDVQTPLQSFSSQKATINWKVFNSGQGNTFSTGWTDAIYLSTDSTLEFRIDKELTKVANFSSLESGNSYNQSAEVILPHGISGKYYVFICSDFYNQVEETNNKNNVSAPTPILVDLTPPPDLKVKTVAYPFNAFSGQEINLSWIVENTGDGNTMVSNWKDAVFCSNELLFNQSESIKLGEFEHSGFLSSDSSYTATGVVRLPMEISGPYYLYVVTDFNDKVYEHASESNNSERGEAITIILSNPADLTVTDMSVVASASSNEKIEVAWEVENQGLGNAYGTWSDKIYFSSLPEFNKETAILAGTKSHKDLPSGQNYSSALQIQVPDDISGDNYVFVVTDADENIFESVMEPNNSSYSSIKILVPDLVLKGFRYPSSAKTGDTISIGYDIHNIGTGKVIDKTFNLALYVSNSPAYDPINLIQIGVFTISDTIESNVVKEYESQIVLPKSVFGSFYIYLFVDSDFSIFEFDESNNHRKGEKLFAIALAPYANLHPTGLTLLQSTVMAGSKQVLNYTVKNEGNETLIGTWTDRFYLSKNLFIDKEAIMLFENTVTDTLISGDSYTVEEMELNMPISYGGEMARLIMITDYYDKVYEHTDEDDNIISSELFTIQSYPNSDLKVMDLVVPTLLTPGEPYILEATVMNNSLVDIPIDRWKDAVFLTSGPNLDINSEKSIDVFYRYGVLEANQSYNVKMTLTIPEGLSGNKYIHYVTDIEKQSLDQNLENNKISKTVSIKKIPYMDLKAVEFTAPFEIVAGQPVDFSYNVENIGQGEPGKKWIDRVYLSNDNIISSQDNVLYSREMKPSMVNDDKYGFNGQGFIPANAKGYYVLIFSCNAFSDPYEENYENNIKLSNILVKEAKTCDLIVDDIQGTPTVIAGDNLEASWSLSNIGENPASGFIREAVYLSKDTIWDVYDVLVGTLDSKINLPPGQSETHTIDKKLISAGVGDHYIFVITDIKDNYPELSEENNYNISESFTNLQVPDLAINSSEHYSLASESELQFRIQVPSNLVGESLMLTIKGDTINGNNQLYLRKGNMPTTVLYDFGSFTPYEGYQRIIVPELTEGNYYVYIKGSSVTMDVQNLEIKNQVMEFRLISATPSFGGSGGTVTSFIEGSKFSSETQISLEKDGMKVMAESVFVDDVTTLYATFNLSGLLAGNYDLVASNKDGSVVKLSSPFLIEEQISSDFQVKVVQPSAAASASTVAVTIEYNNGGNTDIYDPVITVNSYDAPLSFTINGLRENKQELLIPVGEIISGKRVLRPGQRSSVVFYSNAMGRLVYIVSKSFEQ
jgi:hypothetical protein